MNQPQRTAADATPAQRQPPLTAFQAAFRNLIDQNADGVLVVRRDGTIAFVNPAAEAILGRTRDLLIGHPFGVPIAPGATAEVDLIRPTGEARSAEMRTVSIMWEGEPATLASLRDDTERKNAEEALQFLLAASEELSGSLDEATTLHTVARLAASRLGDWCRIDLLDDRGRLDFAAAAHGNPEQETRLRDLERVADRDPLLRGLLDQVFRTGQSLTFAAFGDSPKARRALPPAVRAMQFRAMRIVPLVARGRTLGTLLLAEGVSQSRPCLVRLTLAQDFAHRAAAAIENARLYHAAQEESRRRGEFVAMLSHELRNPLGAIRNAAELLKTADGNGRIAQARAVIGRQVTHVSRMVDDLLDAARITRGMISLQKEPLRLSDVIRHAVQTGRPFLDARNHQVEVKAPPEQLTVEADATRLEQVLTNLLNNAAKYTEPGGRITVSAEQQGREAVVFVRDTGSGICPQILPHVFEMFATRSSLDRTEGGLGIGLTLVRSLVELHGGRVSARNRAPGPGSEFEVRLPLSEKTVRPSSPAVGVGKPASGRRVLLVEDGPDNREMLRQLIGLWGHDIEVACDGAEGLARALAWQPEIGLIDIGLPKLNGYELAERLRAREGSARRTYLIALTGYGQPQDRQRSADAGFDLHLVKPVNLGELERVLAGVGRDVPAAKA